MINAELFLKVSGIFLNKRNFKVCIKKIIITKNEYPFFLKKGDVYLFCFIIKRMLWVALNLNDIT